MVAGKNTEMQAQGAIIMNDLTESEKKLIINYRHLDPDKKQALDMIITAFIAEKAAEVFGDYIKSNKAVGNVNIQSHNGTGNFFNVNGDMQNINGEK